MGIGMQSVIKRLPIMIAPFLGGVLIDRFGMITGVRIGLVVSIVFSAATIGVQRQLRETPPPTAAAIPERWNFWRSLTSFNSPLRRLLLSDILIRFCERIPFAWVVIYAMDYCRYGCEAGRPFDHDRDAGGDALHHSGFAFRR